MNRMPRKYLLTFNSIYPKCFDDVQLVLLINSYAINPVSNLMERADLFQK